VSAGGMADAAFIALTLASFVALVALVERLARR
jgi:hypothetical protein